MTRSTEKLIRAALRDGCREHCDALIDELRRLSAENEAFGIHLSERMKDLARVEAQRDALLAIVRRIADQGCVTDDGCGYCLPCEAEAAIKAALAEPQEPDSPERRCGGPGCDGTCCQPVQEPIGYLWPTGRHPEFRFTQQKRDGIDGTPVYTSPLQRLPLTDEEIEGGSMKDEIIKMAREAGFEFKDRAEPKLERFFHAAYAAGAAAERETLLPMLKGIDRTQSDDRDGWWEMSTDAKWGARLLATIRARGETK